MSKHTPGPWHVTQSAFGQTVWAGTDDDPKIIADKGEHTEMAAADARLIAAAPELLAACQLFTQGARDAVQALNDAGIPCPSSIALAAEKARAAIARAEGKS